MPTHKLSKTEKKLVSQGSAQAGKRLRAASRATRMIAVPAAVAVSKAEAVAGPMIPSFTLPVLGSTKASTLAGYVGAGYYMLAKNPGTIATAVGLSGLGLICRAQKA